MSFPFLLRAGLLLLPWAVSIKKFLYWLLEDTVQSGDTGRAIVDQAVADWIVAQRSFGRLPLIAATVIQDWVIQDFPIPTLFLDGEHEKVYSAQKAVTRLNRLAPQLKTEIIPQVGHDIWIYKGDLVTRKILNFLDEPKRELSS